MWDLPGPGLEPVSRALAGRFLTTAPPGKSLITYVFLIPPKPGPDLAFPISYPFFTWVTHFVGRSIKTDISSMESNLATSIKIIQIVPLAQAILLLGI